MLPEGRTSDAVLKETLKTLGLSSREADAYLQLGRVGRLTAAELARRTSIPRPEAYRVLQNLEDKGFVRELLGKPTKFEPVDPITLRSKILQNERRRLASIEEGMSKVLEVWPLLKAVQLPKERLPRTTTIRGRKRIAATVNGMLDGAQETVSMSTTRRGLMTAMERDFWELSKRLTAMGVEVRMLIDEHSLKRLPPSMIPENVEVRVNTGPKTRFYLVDDKEVLFHLHLQAEDDIWGRDEVALWTDSPDQVNMYRWLFKNEWDNSLPFEISPVVSRRMARGEVAEHGATR